MAKKGKPEREAGGLFDVLNTVLGLVAELKEKGGEISRSGEIGGLGKDVRGVYGFSVRTLVGGEPAVESFGNIRETAAGPTVDEVREPIVDVIEEKDKVVLLGELPGVSEGSIRLEIKGDVVSIRAEENDCKYAKEVLLPCAVAPKPMSVTARNGVVEVRLRKVTA